MTQNVKDLAYTPGPGIFVDAHSFTLPRLPEVPEPLPVRPDLKDIAIMNMMAAIGVVNFIITVLTMIYCVVIGNYGPMLTLTFPVAFTSTLAFLIANKKLGRAKYDRNRNILRARCDLMLADDGRGTLFGYVQDTDHFSQMIAEAMRPKTLPKLKTKPGAPYIPGADKVLPKHTPKPDFSAFQAIADKNTAIHAEMQRMDAENTRIGAMLHGISIEDQKRLELAAKHADALDAAEVSKPSEACDYLLHGAFLMLNHPKCSETANRSLHSTIRSLEQLKKQCVLAEKAGHMDTLVALAESIAAIGESMKDYAEKVLV